MAVVPSSYDFETNTAGLYRGDFSCVTLEQYDSSTCPLTVAILLTELYRHPDWQGVFVANNEFIMGVADGYYRMLHYSELNDPDKDYTHINLPGVGCTWHPSEQVGWVKTVPICKDVPQPPYALMVDKFGQTSLDYKSTFTLPGAIPCRDPALYKELIQRGADYVYMTADGPIFKKGVK